MQRGNGIIECGGNEGDERKAAEKNDSHLLVPSSNLLLCSVPSPAGPFARQIGAVTFVRSCKVVIEIIS